MPRPPAYDLIAIDLDGTLLGNLGDVSDANAHAINRARRAGIRVTVCTGRGLAECRHILSHIRQTDPVVVAGGSMVACPQTSATLHRFPMDPALVGRLVDCLVAHEHAVMILKDPHPTGYDYTIVSPRGPDALDPVTRWWFEIMGINPRYVSSLSQDEHPDHTVRVGVCGTRRATARAAVEVRDAFGHEVSMNHFQAVAPLTGGATDPEDATVILETFSRNANKWSAIQWISSEHAITPQRIAAIGNDVNDLDMLRAAGLGIAMGNAVDEARAIADRHTLANDADGVAHAIDQIIAGAW